MLRVDWCQYKAAKYAVENWHYSKSMPMPPLVMVGAWEDSKYIGCVLFARGANKSLGEPWGLTQTECAELVRVALTKHTAPVSQIVARAVKFLQKHDPAVRALISYADPSEGHHGGIYQAMGWVYTGTSAPSEKVFFRGEWVHKRTVTAGAFGQGTAVAGVASLPRKKTPGKHRYALALDAATREVFAVRAKPYPKRPAKGSSVSTTDREGGSIPTTGLQSMPSEASG